MKLKLDMNSEFKLIPTGEQVLKIVKATALPAGNPQTIEVVFADENGARVTSNYNIKDERGMVIFSILINRTMGNVPEFDTVDLPKLVGKYVLCEIVHKEVASQKNPGKMLTFCNIAKILEGRTGFATTNVDFNVDEDDLD